MKKGTIIIVVLALIAVWAISAYNGMVGIQEEATNALANVHTRRKPSQKWWRHAPRPHR